VATRPRAGRLITANQQQTELSTKGAVSEWIRPLPQVSSSYRSQDCEQDAPDQAGSSFGKPLAAYRPRLRSNLRPAYLGFSFEKKRTIERFALHHHGETPYL